MREVIITCNKCGTEMSEGNYYGGQYPYFTVTYHTDPTLLVMYTNRTKDFCSEKCLKEYYNNEKSLS